MFKKKTSLLVALTCFSSVLALSSCGRGNPTEEDSFDETKTTLGIKYYKGGLGRDWLDKVCDDFIETFKDYSFEPGKKGIQIRRGFEKQDVQVDAVTKMKETYQLFVMENVDYYNFLSKNTMLDVTDVVTKGALKGISSSNELDYENDSIESKMFVDSRDFYDVGSGANKKFHGIPFYDSACSINYNIDLFEDRGFYFASGKTAEDFTDVELNSYTNVAPLFVSSAEEERSLGPDGKTGIIDGVNYSLDDGLPATYKDFYALLTYMRNENVTPMAWNGYERGYLISLALNVWNSAIGYQEARNSITFSGTSTKILDLDNNFYPKKDKDGNYLYETDLNIDSSNVYKVHQQEGLLGATQFVKNIMSNKDNYLADGFKSSFMHTTAQNYFINSDDPTLVEKPIGMLVEGAWWNSEASSSYNGNDKHVKRFGIMPIPHPNASKIGEPNLTLSERDSTLFINAECPENLLPAAKMFLSYVNNERSLNTFTEKTDMVRLLNYEITQETYDKLTPYGQNAYRYFTSPNTKHVDWRPMTNEAYLRGSALSYRKWGYSIDASNDNPFNYFYQNENVTAEDYFAKINKYYSLSWKK